MLQQFIHNKRANKNIFSKKNNLGTMYLCRRSEKSSFYVFVYANFRNNLTNLNAVFKFLCHTN